MSVRPSVRRLVGRSVSEHESKSVKMRISAPDHPSATGGRVSGLVFCDSLPLTGFLTLKQWSLTLYRITVILTVLRQVLLGLGNDVASRDSLFTSIADTFQEFVVEYAELMTEDDERLGDLKKILRYILKFKENDARAN